MKNTLKLNSIKVESNDDVLLLESTIDKKLTFKQDIEIHKLHALRRITRFLAIGKTKTLGNVFIRSQFNYAPLLWMLSRNTLYSKMGKIHHETLKVIYESNDTYGNLLLQSNTVPVHQRHIHITSQ